jgi:hypothetical protein
MKGGGNLALYFLHSLNKEDIGRNNYGYSSIYQGLSVILNSQIYKQKGIETQNVVHVHYNNGGSLYNPATDSKQCLSMFRNLQLGEEGGL